MIWSLPPLPDIAPVQDNMYQTIKEMNIIQAIAIGRTFTNEHIKEKKEARVL